MDTIGKIREIRIQNNITQSLMAERLGIAPNNYGKIEKGITELTISRLRQIAEILGVSVLELLGGDATIQSTENKQDTHKLEARIEELEERIREQKSVIDSKDYIISALNNEFNEFTSKFFTILDDELINKGLELNMIDKTLSKGNMTYHYNEDGSFNSWTLRRPKKPYLHSLQLFSTKQLEQIFEIEHIDALYADIIYLFCEWFESPVNSGNKVAWEWVRLLNELPLFYKYEFLLAWDSPRDFVKSNLERSRTKID